VHEMGVAAARHQLPAPAVPDWGGNLSLPSAGSAVQDRRLTDTEARQLLRLHLGALDIGTYRPLKLAALALETGLDERRLGRALARFVLLGYLHCGEADAQAPLEARGTRPRWYRLSYAGPPRP
jgi:hypothetical protein